MPDLWRWNYYTVESLNIIRCSLCDAKFKPKLISNLLRKHIDENKHDGRHFNAFCQINRRGPQKQALPWDYHYTMEDSENILHPKVKCNYCYEIINTSGYKFLQPQKITEHLENVHKVNVEVWDNLQRWINTKAHNYGIEYSKHDNNVMILENCKKCKIASNINLKSGIRIVEHLITRHLDDILEDLPLDIIPKEFHKYVPLRREQPSSDPGVILGASSVQPSAAKDIALSSDRPSSDLRNIPGTSAQECPSSSKRKRDSSTETDRKRKKFYPTYDPTYDSDSD